MIIAETQKITYLPSLHLFTIIKLLDLAKGTDLFDTESSPRIFYFLYTTCRA